jgi:hypothetical protein
MGQDINESAAAAGETDEPVADDAADEGQKAEESPGEPAGPAPPPGGDPGDPGDKGLGRVPKAAQIAAWTYFALLVAVLAALGIQGDILTRLIRNLPLLFGLGVVLAIVGGVVSAAVLIWPEAKHARGLLAAGIAAAVVGVCVSVGSGIFSFSTREAPSLDLVVTQTADNTLHVTVDAAAISLKSDESMLLRVITLADPPPDNPYQYCHDSTQRGQDMLKDTKILLWAESGVTSSGEATTNWSADIDEEGVRYVCAMAIVSPRSTNEERTSVVGIVDVTKLVIPTPSPTPTPTSPSSTPPPQTPTALAETGG